jgi:hypothetical protein
MKYLPLVDQFKHENWPMGEFEDGWYYMKPLNMKYSFAEKLWYMWKILQGKAVAFQFREDRS